MVTQYKKICSDLLRTLPEKQREVISRRFGLTGGEGETLESIGQSFNITRERVRQIERDASLRIKPEAEKYSKIFQNFSQYFKKSGGLKKEDILLQDLGGKKYQAEVYFLLTLSGKFERIGETENFHSLWLTDKNILNPVSKTIDGLFNKLKEVGKPVSFKELSALSSSGKGFLLSYLEISKKIQKNEAGLYGLKDWPEINPRGVKDKAYLAFKKANKPLHFVEVAKLIGGALTQTVHNELIRDPRFILVGRGTYALADWGYYPGQVKDVIQKVLVSEQKPLTKKEILEKVLSQRLVKENTILLNLSNRKYFLRDPQGKYTVKES